MTLNRNTSPTQAELYEAVQKYAHNMLALLNDKTAEITDAGCWIWKGAPTAQMGYGRLSIGPRHDHLVIYAHRLAYMIYRGNPGNLSVLHKCDVPLCFNPDHLFLGTAGDNIRDATAKGRQRNQNKGKTHCKNGHPLTGDNVKVETTGFRRCQTCVRIYQREWRKNHAR